MGDVYRARQVDMGNRTVAVKIPKAGQSRVAQRFEREIIASSRLKHENIVCAYDRGEQLGRPFLVMEYVAGKMLRDVVESEHPLSPHRVGRVLLGVARGLAHAGQQRIVNRDLKPDNIILASAPDETPKIVDYGLALIADIDGTSFETTRSGAMLGTPRYQAPEQASDPHNVTIAADVYSLGCTGFYSLTRQPPFSASTLDELCRHHAELERPSLRGLRPDVPEEFDCLVQRMMAINPASRPTPTEIVTALVRLVPQLADVRPQVESPVPDRIEVVCPACGETYHLMSTAVGKRLTCRNKLCQHRFEVELPVAEAIVADAIAIPAEEADELAPPPVVVATLPTAAVTAEYLGAGGSIPTLPVEAIVAEPAALSEAPPLQFGGLATVVPIETVPILPAQAIVHDPSISGSRVVETDLAPPPRQQVPGPYPASGVASPSSPGEAPPVWQAIAVEENSGVARPAQADAFPPRQGGRRMKKFHLVEIAAGLLVVGLGGYVGWFKWDQRARAPEKRWQEVQDLYSSKRWTPATKAFLQYKEDFPDSPNSADVDFFVKLCAAREAIYSTTGDPAKGLAEMQGIFKEFRDSSSYKSYAFDLHKASAELIERFTKRAREKKRPADIGEARQAAVLMHTVAESLTDPALVEYTGQLDAQIDQAERDVRTAVAKDQVTKLLVDAGDPRHQFSSQQLDGAYRQIEDLLAAHAELAGDKNLTRLREAMVGAEAQRVRYRPSEGSPAEMPLARSGGSQTIAVAWDAPSAAPHDSSKADSRRRGPGPALETTSDGLHAPEPVAALANGVLYVFDRGGKLLWTRRLGLDSDRLPSPVAATPLSPDAFVVASSEDAALLSLEAATGEVRWSVPTPGTVIAPLTIVETQATAVEPAKRRGLLPTAAGTIHVFELVRGNRMGVYQVGQPINVGGAFDETSGLVFFAAEAQRVFAINAAKIDHPDDPGVPACRSILFTGHPSGALRSEPLVVGRYCVLVEASELEEMRLSACEIGPTGFSNPRAKPLGQMSLVGWSWFPPQSAPDQVALVTDRGELGLFGFNLDNPDEAIYPLVVDASRTPSTRLAAQGDSRAAVIHAEENLLWVLVNDKLQKLAIDVLKQKIKPLWKLEAAPTLGVPVHEPQSFGWDTDLMFYLTTMSPDGRRFLASAVRGESGEVVWQRQLGVSPLADPLVSGKQLFIIDRSGRVLRLPVPAKSQAPRPPLEPDGGGALPADVHSTELTMLGYDDHPTHLLARLGDGKRLALRSLGDHVDQSEWRQINLPESMHGLPCIVDNVLVVPCADGLLHRFSADGGRLAAANEDNFRWTTHEGPKVAQLVALEKDAVLLVDGAGRVQRLEFRTVDVVEKWEPIGHPFSLTGELVGAPLLQDDLVLLVERTGTVHALDAKNPGRPVRRWKLSGRPTGKPVLRGGRLLVALDHKRLDCIDPTSGEADSNVAWTAEFAGRICGAPVSGDDVLLVTDEGRHVTGLRMSDGQAIWSTELPVQAGPAAAAVPFGDGQMLLPLRDGTLLVLPVPPAGPEVAEATP